MNADSSALVLRVDGRGGTAGAHDAEVGEDPLDAGGGASATRCSGSTPRSMSPAAIAYTRSAAWPQLSDFHSSGPWPEAGGTGWR